MDREPKGLLHQVNIDTTSTALEVGIAVDTTSDADEAIGRDTASSEVIQHRLTTEARETLVLSSKALLPKETQRFKAHFLK